MADKSSSGLKTILIILWIVITVCLLYMVIISNKISPIGKVALITIIFTGFFGPLAIARANRRRKAEGEDED